MTLYLVGESDWEARTVTLLCEGPEGFDWKAARREWAGLEKADRELPISDRRWLTRIVEEWIGAHPDLEVLDWEWVETDEWMAKHL